jgi:putative ABC transport system permease protein
MKYVPLVWAGLRRKPVRSILTGLSIAVAFLLFGLLQGINQGTEFLIRDLHLDRLYVMNRVSGTMPQPFANLARVAEVPGVRAVAPWTFFAGYFRDSRNQIPAIATNLPVLFSLYPELKLPAEQLQAMERTRTGAIIGRPLALRFGWKVGDRVPLGTSIWQQSDGSPSWYFDVVGIFDVGSATPVYPNAFFINYDYFDEARATGKGLVHMFVTGISDPKQAAPVAKRIDALFVNSGTETRTQDERAYGRAQLRQIGDIQLIANSVVGAALFALLFVTANTMMQSIRERIPEFAVLKTIGFSDRKVLAIVLSESLLLCVFAAIVGLALAALLFPGVARIFGMIKLQSATILMGLAMAIVVAVLSGLPPAWRAKRLSIVDAFAGR